MRHLVAAMLVYATTVVAAVLVARALGVDVPTAYAVAFGLTFAPVALLCAIQSGDDECTPADAIEQTVRGPFILGYVTALDDIDRTGRQPFTDQAKRAAAERAYRKLVADHE